jgi:TRAP transporter 4TM/12TM fusion protein/TRAP transporter TAXI family solute receptor
MLLIMLSILLLSCSPKNTKFVSIGTGGVTGVYYPTGGAISRMINKKFDEYNIKATVESTGGSVFNINAVLSGDLDFGIAQSDRQYQAYNGLAEWTQAGNQPDLRSVFSIHPEAITLIASENSEINTLEDLKNKRINLGNPGSGQLQNSVDIINSSGLTENDILAEYVKAIEAPGLLQDERIDAFFYTVGHPNGNIKEATSGRIKVRIIPIEGPRIDKLLEKDPYYAKVLIPVEFYPKALNTEDIETIGVKATFITSKNVDDNIVYAITKEVFENFDEFKTLHPAYKVLTKQNMLQGLTAPSIAWALFQLSLPKFIIMDSIKVRAIHLAFAVTLVFLTQPFLKKKKTLITKKSIPLFDYILAVVACFAVLYLMFYWTDIAMRSGTPILADIIIGTVLILLLLEASRRVIGPALSIIAILFTLYAFLGPYMPSIFAFKGVSLTKYMSQIALSTEGIYGIPLDVSANTVFLFVLLGSMKGGPAKAAVVSSGLTGIVSGSSIANVVTTGTFTIPLMKKVGYPAKIAAATEVAASTNGQLMPPIMGAAAFIIAEYLSLPYLEVIKAAALPAVVSYFALFYITHLEASKLGMKGLPKADIPQFTKVLKNGFFYLIPLIVLLYELIIIRHTPKLAAYNAIISLIIIVFIQEIYGAIKYRKNIKKAFNNILKKLVKGLIAGSRNMLSVALATATAGVVVGIVTMGIGSMIVQIVETISGGNIFLLLLITAIASLILGMGLPTTATYIVMASITVPVIIKISAIYSISPIPAISAHLFCFYFGILADDTPPVGLAAYTAAAIARSDPIATGVQGFIYDLRTAVIPFMFVFNPELILFKITNIFQIILIFGMAVVGVFAFTNAVQGWFVVKNKWYEIPIFLLSSVILFYPAILTKLFDLNINLRYYFYIVGLILYGIAYLSQNLRKKYSSMQNS